MICIRKPRLRVIHDPTIPRKDLVHHQRCEDCALHRPTFGLPAEKAKRWCFGCAKAHVGAQRLGKPQHNIKCEDCAIKQPSWGLAGEDHARWCSGCGKTHAGAVGMANRIKKCEDCAQKQPSWKFPSDERPRWCAGCATAHVGAHRVKRITIKRCEDCMVKQPSWGMPSARQRRWCAECAKKQHAGACHYKHWRKRGAATLPAAASPPHRVHTLKRRGAAVSQKCAKKASVAPRAKPLKRRKTPLRAADSSANDDAEDAEHCI